MQRFFFSDHATLILNIILIFYLSLFRTQAYSYKFHIIKTRKLLKILEYLKTKFGSNGFLFLQETHSSIADEKKWADELKGLIFFPHGKINPCGVAIGYIGNNKVDVLDKKTDKNGRILILGVMVDETNFVLVNIYNPNTKTEYITTLLDLGKMLETIKDFSNKHIVLAGDFNFFFDTFLESRGRKPTLKKKSIATFIELKENSICVTFGE